MEEGQSGPMYRLDLPPGYKLLHPVFSVDRLSPWRGNDVNGIHLPPPALVIIDGQQQWEVKDILDSQKWGQGLQYLVHWQGYNKSHNSWQLQSQMLEDAPEAVEDFHKTHPGVPQAVKASFWKHIVWKLYKNLTKTIHPGVEWVTGKFPGILACWGNKP
jgi:phage-related protein